MVACAGNDLQATVEFLRKESEHHDISVDQRLFPAADAERWIWLDSKIEKCRVTNPHTFRPWVACVVEWLPETYATINARSNL